MNNKIFSSPGSPFVILLEINIPNDPQYFEVSSSTPQYKIRFQNTFSDILSSEIKCFQIFPSQRTFENCSRGHGRGYSLIVPEKSMMIFLWFFLTFDYIYIHTYTYMNIHTHIHTYITYICVSFFENKTQGNDESVS